MEQARHVVMVAAALTAMALLTSTAFTANAQDGDVTAGRTFAREACNFCHVVKPTNASPRIVAIGPTFRKLQTPKG